MKRLIVAAFIFVSTFSTNVLAEIKMGVILGFTGPIESLTPAMAASAELAFKEASDSGSLLGGKKISVIRADSTCVDSAAATAAAEQLGCDGHRHMAHPANARRRRRPRGWHIYGDLRSQTLCGICASRDLRRRSYSRRRGRRRGWADLP